MSKLIKIGIGLGVLAMAYNLLKNKAAQLTAQFGDIKIIPIGFKNVNAKWNSGKPSVSFNIDLSFLNPTPVAFNADGVILSFKKILFYDNNGVFLGETTPNITVLNIPAKSSTIVRNVPVSLDLQTSLINAIKIINNGGFNISEIKTEAIISVLGIEYKLNQ